MLTNTERQQIVEEVNAGTYGIDEALDDIAAAQKGEEVRKALYAEALVLNREGHAGSTDMIARQQIANLQTSVNGQISTLRSEVGDDIDDLETALNNGLATQNGKIAAQNATIANVVANYNVEYGSTELWASTGETGALAAGTTVTLSEDVSHFDYIDIYSFCGNSNVLDTVPVDAKLQSNAGYALRWVNLSDPGSGTYQAYVRIVETRLHIIGTTLTIDHQVTYRNGEEVNISGAEVTQSNRSTYMGEFGIMKIVGRKITANTEIEDVRIGADGTEYNSAGQAVRAQVTALESAIPAVDSTLSTQGAAADAKVVGDEVTQLKADLGAYSNNAIKALSFSDGTPSGDYSIVFPTFIQGGISTSGTTITYNTSKKDIRTETPISGGHLIHNLDTNNNNTRVYIFYNGTYTGAALRDAEWNTTMYDEWIYLPIISGYTYQICFHTTGSGVTPESAPIEMLRIAESKKPLNDVVPGYSWNLTEGAVTNSKRAYMIFPGVKKGDVIKFDGERYSVNYYVLGGNLTDLFYTRNVWDSTGEIKVNVPDDKSYQLFVQFKWSNDAKITEEKAAYISTFTQIITELKTIDLFMFMGQSNMAGRGITNSTWTEKAPKINYGAGYEFKAISDPTKLYPALEPFGVDENQTGGIDDTTPDNEDLTTGASKKTGSCVVALMNTYFGVTGIPIVGVSASEGGTTIAQWQPDTDRLDDAINRLNNAVTWLEANGYYIRHKYMMWCQGENDSSTPSADYKASFSAMFGAMKTAGIEKCFLARIGEYNNDSSTAYSAMIQCQTEMGQEMADVIMCTTDLASFRDRGLMKDKYHFYQAAYNEMGRYSGANIAVYVETGKEPTMYDPKYNNLYYSHKN